MSAPPPGPPGPPHEPYYAPGWALPPPPRQRRRRTWLVIGIVAGLVLLALVAAGAARLGLWSQTRELGAIDEQRGANAQQVGVGHCLETLPDDGDVGQVRLVPCDVAHEAEVIGAVELTAPWPGQDQVDARVAESCRMSTAEREDGLVAVIWSPTRESWRQGDRTGLCLAVDGAAVERR